MAMITMGKVSGESGGHPVFSEVLRIHFLEPLLEPFGVRLRALGAERLVPFEHVLFDEDLRLRPEREGDRVARPAVDVPALLASGQVDSREEGVVAKLVDYDALDADSELGD